MSKAAEYPYKSAALNEDVKSFLDLAMKRWKASSEEESERRSAALEDFKFRMGEQWPDKIKADRDADNRPCLTMNRLPSQIRQVTNEQRQQRPAVQVNPVGDGADTDTAEVLQGMVRHIEVNSDAEIAYDHAFECMVTGGIGYIRLITEYVDDESDQQELKIDWVENPFLVYLDPAAKKHDRSDGEFAFVVCDYTLEQYKEEYPESELAGLEEFSSIGDQEPDWVSKDGIRVAEYFYVEKTKAKNKAGREVIKRKVKWALINAVEILAEREWAGKWIPIIPVLGDQINIDGKRHLAGLVRNAKDPQRQINYWTTCATEQVALASKAPYVVAEGQIEDFPEWQTLNTRLHAALRYKPVDVGGRPVEAPHRDVAEPPIQAMVVMLNQASNELKSVTGLYDPSLGNAKSDQSGKAIQSLQKQGDLGTLNYSDNLSRSIRNLGRQIIQAIPLYYDTKRIQRIIKPDQSTDMVHITNSNAAS